jgi:hypothetical protein
MSGRPRFTLADIVRTTRAAKVAKVRVILAAREKDGRMLK